MKRIVLLVCIGSLTLALTARGEEQNNPPQKKGAPKAQPSQRAAAVGRRGGTSNFRQMGPQRTFSTAPFRQPTFKTAQTMGPNTSTALVNRSIAATTAARGQTRVAVTNNWRGPNFTGRQYTAFRNYQSQWHDSDWWWHHRDRIVFVTVFAQPFPFFFDAGYWYPCWGYYPGAYYPYDGPIYGYNGLPPDQVVTNVQIQLQSAGYYSGPIDGVLGPLTRAAIADYQRDHGLAITAAIDEPTVVSLGLV
jgi:putative peptidoglycan binding protein